MFFLQRAKIQSCLCLGTSSFTRYCGQRVLRVLAYYLLANPFKYTVHPEVVTVLNRILWFLTFYLNHLNDLVQN